MFGLLKKIFGTAQERHIRKYRKTVEKVCAIEQTYHALTDEQLKHKTVEFKRRFQSGESLDSLLPEAYAVVKNACRRLCGQQVHVFGYDQKWDMVPFDVQILGAIAMHHGAIAEMQTGEGKTLTSAMPLYLNALSGNPVHLITVNDYLVQRDCEWIGTIFRWLGLTVRFLTNQTPAHERKEIYNADIVYGTASEFGFDYLRDNSMAQRREEQVQRGYFFAVIDEVDSILIDEARTPLIISGAAPTSRQMYGDLKEDVTLLVQKQKQLCEKLGDEAEQVLKSIGRLDPLEEGKPPMKLSKKDEAKEKEAFHQLWLVSKGMPQNAALRRVVENPDLRAGIDSWDLYYYADPNKEERYATLAKLYIIVDERASKYELTDLGMQEWVAQGKNNSLADFTMIDLGFEYAEIDRNPNLTEQEKIERKVALREEDATRKERYHNLKQLFRAHLLMEKDVDYIVVEEKIVIIDENTGRPQPGRRFSDGLHQAIEAKEGVEIQGETQTFATITLQNYFRMYEKLTGMTGTAITEASEFKEIYKIDVLVIPTHRVCRRLDYDDEIYMTEREKNAAILKEIKEVHATGRPILVGTESVDVSEKLSRILNQAGLPHTVLNAKNHKQEAEIIANAGTKGAITVATNMAGRGTDIKLKEDVEKLGGLYVLGTTRHQSRRIDRQLKGRSARLGDRGSSKFFVSFEDPLMRLFTSPRITAILQRFRPPEGEAIKAKILNRSIETAQKRVEQRNYSIRKHTLEYDDVMNFHRTEIYSLRNEVLCVEDTLELAKEIIASLCKQMSEQFLKDRHEEGAWNTQGYRQWLMASFPVTFDEQIFESEYLTIEQIQEIALDQVGEIFDKKLAHEIALVKSLSARMGEVDQLRALRVINEVLRSLMVRAIDKLWQEHLLAIDHLRSDVSVRAIGQKDPLVEFKHEAFRLFNDLVLRIKMEVAHSLFRFAMRIPEPEPELELPEMAQIETEEEIEVAKVEEVAPSLIPAPNGRLRPAKFSLENLVLQPTTGGPSAPEIE